MVIIDACRLEFILLFITYIQVSLLIYAQFFNLL